MAWLAARAKEAAKEALWPLAAAARRARRGPERLVLVLGHMRSGSSLLHHLLASHPLVRGRGERNKAYRSEADFDRLLVDIWAYRRALPPAQACLCDQINHGRLLPAERLLLHPRVRKVFLVREPLAAVASMVNVLGRVRPFPPEEAADYYVSRLVELRRYAASDLDRGRQFFLTYADLTGTDRRTCLAALSAFLGLTPPLQESYQVFDFTGQRGDTSERIRSGRISAAPSTWSVTLSPALERELRQAYAECLAALPRSCSHARASAWPAAGTAPDD